MKRVFTITAVLFVILISVGIGVLVFNRQARVSEETKWVAEAVRAVEEYLRDGTPIDNTVQPQGVAIDNKVIFDRAAILEKFGSLESITGDKYTGSKYSHPAWNIQGYHYLSTRRTANFSKGPVPLRILVTEGRRTAPGRLEISVNPAIQYDYANHMTITVSHPDLHD